MTWSLVKLKWFEEKFLIGLVITATGLFGITFLDGDCYLLNSCEDGISNESQLWNFPMMAIVFADNSLENFDAGNETIFEFQPGNLKFDPELDGLSCEIDTNPKIKTGRSLNIDAMENHFFIILGKTDFGEYHYLQIEMPEKEGNSQTASYLLDFKKQGDVVKGGLYQDYDQLAVYMETDKEPAEIDPDNYKRFLVSKSNSVSPSSESIGPGNYDLHAILFQSDQETWIKDEVCALSLHWNVVVDSVGYINPEEPSTSVGRIYEVEKEIYEKTHDIDPPTKSIISNSESQKNEEAQGKTETGSDYYLGTIEWTEKSSSPDGYGIVRIFDPDMNSNSTRVDYFPISVWSGADTIGIEVAMVESDVDTGVFYGDVGFSQEHQMSHTLKVSSNDLVTALYEDYTLPTQMHQNKIELSDILKISSPYMGPFRQLEQGMLIEDITCIGDKLLFIKDNSKPLCLKQKTFEILMKRGYF